MGLNGRNLCLCGDGVKALVYLIFSFYNSGLRDMSRLAGIAWAWQDGRLQSGEVHDESARPPE